MRAAMSQPCPLIIGSLGFSGAEPQFSEAVTLLRRIITEEAGSLGRSVKLAVIPADIPAGLLDTRLDKLTALGQMPPLTAATLRGSKLVGQMGIEPIITALQQQADIIVCGRTYDPAVFAALPIMRGFDPGIAYHAGKILECGAIASTPGSGADCLLAELHADGRAVFRTPNPARACTPASIAAHTLYEKSRPDYFHLPGGTLSIQHSSFRALDEGSTEVRGSRFRSSAPSIKLEGARTLGQRLISILAVDKQRITDPGLPVYGRNGVEARHSEQELGILVQVRGPDAGQVHDLLASLRSGLLHFGYPGRISTAGNLAFPCSPSDIDIRVDGQACSFFIAGSRDPVFMAGWPAIREGLLAQVAQQMPELLQGCEIDFFTTDEKRGLAFIETVDDAGAHTARLAALTDCLLPDGPQLRMIDAGLASEWTLHHLLRDTDLLAGLFPLTLWQWQQGKWQQGATLPCDWRHACHSPAPPADENFGLLPAAAENKPAPGKRRKLPELAAVIRSKNAGINELTYDILFRDEASLDYAIRSGAFTPANMSRVLAVAEADVLACLCFRAALAIKVTVQRQLLAGNPGDRDIFGAQQHAPLLAMEI